MASDTRQGFTKAMTNDNLGANKHGPHTTAVSTGRRDHRDDRGASNSAKTSSEKRPRSNASAQTGGRSGAASRPVETDGCKTRNGGDPVLIADGGRDRECPECEKLLVYHGECAGCGWEADEPELTTDGGHDRDRYIQNQDPGSRLREAIKQIGIAREQISDIQGHSLQPHEDDPALAEAEIHLRGVADKLEEADIDHRADEDELITDGGTKYFGGPESKTSRSLRIAIGAKYGRDLRERVDSVGNTAAAVRFRRPLLEEIAEDVLDEEHDIADLSVRELRARIATALDREEPAGHFNWLHLRDLYETVVDPDDVTDPEQVEAEILAGSGQASRTIAGPGDDSGQRVNWRRQQ